MNKLRLRILRKNKDKRALIAGRLLDHKERLINTLLVSNDIVNIFLSSIITSIALDMVGQKGVGIATLIATLLLLIFGEITPKTISTRCPDRIAYALAPFVQIVVVIMHPIVAVVTFIARCVLRIFGIKTNAKKQSYTEEEIKTFFDMSSESGVIEENENRMMSQVFKISDLEAQDIMVPRTKIRAVPHDATYRDIVELSQRLGYTRFPVYRKSIDDIIGIIYLKDMLAYKESQNTFDLNKVMRPPLFIPGTRKITSVVQVMQENRQSMAIIIDEYSGTDGLITQSDIHREIFGTTGNKSSWQDEKNLEILKNQDNFTVDGSTLLVDLKIYFGIKLESNINDTLGGWIIEKLDRIPVVGDFVEDSGVVYTVTAMEKRRITQVQIVKKETEGKQDD